MPRHSKNNTASSVFTYHESKSLDYGTKKQRLGRDSYREYDACFLCLQTARDPVACTQGHLACRECIYESILLQKQNIQREQKAQEQKLKALEDQRLRDEEEAKQTFLDDFEKTQTSMLGNRKKSLKESSPAEKKPSSPSTPKAGVKRSFEESAKEAAQKDLEETSERLANEKAEAAKSKLGSFWLPSLTPEAAKQYKDEIKPINTQTMCLATKDPHPVSIKSLIDVKFQYESESKKAQCPSCLKTFSNASKFSVMRHCGHVLCNACADMFVKKSKKCYVCEKKTKSKDIIDMSPEGTGFASGSKAAVAQKWDIAFQ